jgi:hypothetical protein
VQYFAIGDGNFVVPQGADGRDELKSPEKNILWDS